jgi:hypothetical protein
MGGDLGATATHEVHDLKAVAFREIGLLPLIARNDLKVEFDGDTVPFQAHLRDQLTKAERRGIALVFAVDLQFHEESF